MKVKLYAVEGSSYNGCEGWSSWICEDSVTADIEEAKEFIKNHNSKFVRYEIVVLKEIDVECNRCNT